VGKEKFVCLEESILNGVGEKGQRRELYIRLKGKNYQRRNEKWFDQGKEKASEKKGIITRKGAHLSFRWAPDGKTMKKKLKKQKIKRKKKKSLIRD